MAIRVMGKMAPQRLIIDAYSRVIFKFLAIHNRAPIPSAIGLLIISAFSVPPFDLLIKKIMQSIQVNPDLSFFVTMIFFLLVAPLFYIGAILTFEGISQKKKNRGKSVSLDGTDRRRNVGPFESWLIDYIDRVLNK